MEKISLIITEEQKDTLLSLFGYYGWDKWHTSQPCEWDEITESPKAHKKP